MIGPHRSMRTTGLAPGAVSVAGPTGWATTPPPSNFIAVISPLMSPESVSVGYTAWACVPTGR